VSAPNHEPSPAEIAEACRAIRATWDEETELARRCGGFARVEWRPPGAVRNAKIVDAETLRDFAGPN
jgi:hypothetical protein